MSYNCIKMRNVIITAANEKVENFVFNHWFRSLQQNVDLKNVDVVIFDYGISNKMKLSFEKNGIKVITGMKKYHIVNKRFIDAGKYLQKNKYDQVLFVDSSDVIFQTDLTKMFNTYKKYFRAVKLGSNVLFVKALVYDQFGTEDKNKIWDVIKNKPIINAGVIFAPANKFVKLCISVDKMIRNKDDFGPDQIIVNYFLFKNGVKFIDSKYNFTMNTAYAGFKIINGIFYKSGGEKIAIVHNCGQSDIFRPITNFGYGKNCNQKKPVIYFLKQMMYFCFELYNKIKITKVRNK